MAEAEPVVWGKSAEELRVALAGLAPEDRHLGPAMRALSERQRLYVVACMDMGCWKDHARGARIAGYEGKHPGYARLQGFRLAHNPKVQAAMLEEAKKRMQLGTVGATNFMLELVEDEKADPKLRLKASEMVLDRGGLHGVHGVQQVPDAGGNDRLDKMLRLALLAKALGVDPRQVLGNLVDVMPGDEKLIESNAAADVDLTSGGSAPVTAMQPAAVLVDEESETGA